MGEKRVRGVTGCNLPLNLGKNLCFHLAFHSMVTLQASDYAPPDTKAPNLQLVALERLPSIEGAMEIWMGETILRADSSVAALPGRLLFHKGALGLCGNGWKRNYSAGKNHFG